MGEALLRHSVQPIRDQIRVSSAGVRAREFNLSVDAVAVQMMAERSFDLRNHSPRQVNRDLTASADLILTMTRQDLRAVVVIDRDSFPRVFTWMSVLRRSVMGQFVPSWEGWLAALNDGRTTRDLIADDPADDIADPFGMEQSKYETCVEQLVHASTSLSQILQYLLAPRLPQSP